MLEVVSALPSRDSRAGRSGDEMNRAATRCGHGATLRCRDMTPDAIGRARARHCPACGALMTARATRRRRGVRRRVGRARAPARSSNSMPTLASSNSMPTLTLPFCPGDVYRTWPRRSAVTRIGRPPLSSRLGSSRPRSLSSNAAPAVETSTMRQRRHSASSSPSYLYQPPQPVACRGVARLMSMSHTSFRARTGAQSGRELGLGSLLSMATARTRRSPRRSLRCWV